MKRRRLQPHTFFFNHTTGTMDVIMSSGGVLRLHEDTLLKLLETHPGVQAMIKLQVEQQMQAKDDDHG